jgi:hypothetical protein
VTKKEERPFCEAVSRKQYEAASWGASKVGCGNRGVEQVDGHWVCRVHKDPNKRYGWN